MTAATLLVVGTGGTIAGTAPSAGQTVGYRPGALGIAELLAQLPALADRFDIRTAQPFSIGSQHMDSARWLALAAVVDAALRDAAIAGVVIAHGTDTLEDTAFFLDLALGHDKPVVLTGAMRPATAIGADGPANLACACHVAADARAAGRGVLVAFADRVWAAARVRKRHTLATDAFDGGGREALADFASGEVLWRLEADLARCDRARLPGFPLASLRAGADGRLPSVPLIWQHVDADPAIVDWHLSRGARGLVLAGTGNGTMPAPMRAALATAVRRGCLVLRASRVAEGTVVRDAEPEPADHDAALGFIAAERLAALKARIFLQCALAAGATIDDRERLQALVATY